MNIKIKKITKIAIIILIAITILLITPKEVNASSLTFDCFGSQFTVSGAGENDQYKLMYDVCNAEKISDIPSKWKKGTTITVPSDSNLSRNDGLYIMRRRS